MFIEYAPYISLKSFFKSCSCIFCPKQEEIVTCHRLNGTTTRKMTTTFQGIFFDKYNEGITSVNKFILGYSRNSHAKYISYVNRCDKYFGIFYIYDL